RLLAAYDGSQIVLFFCGTADGHSVQLSVLDGYDPAYPLSLLFAFPQMRNGTPSSVSHVAGVSLLDGSIFCWRVEFSAITHAVSVNQWAGAYSKCNTYPPDCNPPVLLTCSSTGRITYWRCKLSVTNKAEREKGKLWEESYRLKSEDQEGIWKIKCGPEDKVALVNKARDKVSIWEAITPRLPSMKEYVIESSETIIDVDWLYTSCGGLVLAVASAQKITIYTRLRKLDTLVRECWIALTDIQIPLTMCRSVSAISWASSGTLVVAAGNQMRCYCKWMNATKLRQVSRMTGINEKLPTVFHAVSHVNGPLPHHHPS
ncbi:5007_t:CDS:2, partial [Paraglomus occultum]